MSFMDYSLTISIVPTKEMPALRNTGDATMQTCSIRFRSNSSALPFLRRRPSQAIKEAGDREAAWEGDWDDTPGLFQAPRGAASVGSCAAIDCNALYDDVVKLNTRTGSSSRPYPAWRLRTGRRLKRRSVFVFLL